MDPVSRIKARLYNNAPEARLTASTVVKSMSHMNLYAGKYNIACYYKGTNQKEIGVIRQIKGKIRRKKNEKKDACNDGYRFLRR